MLLNNYSVLSIRPLSLLAISLFLAACANEPYVVLLDNPDGTTGKISVNTAKGSTVLEKTKQATSMKDTSGKTFIVSDAQLTADFGSTLAASPMNPKIFLLYFEKGSSTLTKESQDTIPAILAEIKKHPAPDISVIGHSDTKGNDKLNEQISFERADTIGKLIQQESKLPVDKVSIESHGEKNLLIKTPDDTDEPRNRRVEVSVR
jgi:outer membrane protein OmpA-like peptidoglycan-associated protein